MNLSTVDILTYVIVFIVIFSLFYILFTALMVFRRKTSVFGLIGAQKIESDETQDDYIVFGGEGNFAPRSRAPFLNCNSPSEYTIFAGDRIKDLQKNPPSGFEKYVRDKIEKLTGHKFPTVYPSWLCSKINFELDGYNKELGIAFETQGPQHYEFNKKYYTNYPDYHRRILHDQIKRDKCAKYGIGLIIVDHSIPKHLLTYYIGSRLWDICREKSLIDKTACSSKNLPYSKVNCALLAESCGIWGNIAEKPAMYMEKINRTPYRNYELEKQMLLKGIL